MSALSEGRKTVNIDSEVLLRLLPKEYKYKINNIKNLAKSDVLEEQAYFEANICDKEKADKFVKIFGKTNGSDFRPAERQKADRVSSAAVSSVVEK